MRRFRDREELFADPADGWLGIGAGVFWCHSRELCGALFWGRPTAAETAALLAIFDGYRRLAPRFDVLLDAATVEAVDPDALEVLLTWVRANGVLFREHLRRRVSVIAPGLVGLALAGIGPALELDAVTFVSDARAGFRLLLGADGDALCDEVAAIGADDKLATIAARLGLSEDGLTLLVRARSGVTPGELRRRLRT